MSSSAISIPGLYLYNGFIDKKLEYSLVTEIDSLEWNTQLSRRTQHYGYVYPYGTKISKSSQMEKTTPIPKSFIQLVNECKIKGMINNDYNFDQAIVNEYQPGQGISPHCDDTNLFDDIIISFSLLSTYNMVFSKDEQKIVISLNRGSALLLTGESRYMRSHSIEKRKTDEIGGKRVKRERRISITLRKLKV
jgi:alkylated DNA repair dioxygenase AlkB